MLAKTPNPKNAIKDEVELKLKKLATPNLSKIKKAMIIKIAILNATNVGFALFSPLFSSSLFSLLVKSENL